MSSKQTVLIGPVCADPAESVSAVNLCLAEGLQDEYNFVTSWANRRFGATSQSQLNGWNAYYLSKHLGLWIWNLVRHRPRIAHYAVNGGWALWKGLLFLRLARVLGIRTVGHLHSGGFLDFWRKLPEEKRKSALVEFERMDAFVVLSESWRTAMAKEVGVPMARIHVVNNPINPTFERAALEMPVQRPDCIFLAMGIMSRDKGAPDLLEACSRLKQRHPKFRLHLAGPEREPGILARARKHLAEHGLESMVEMPGIIRGDKKIELFRDTSVSILPSYYENFPLVVLEAAAAGHAIITTPVGAVPEFFENGVSALFIEPGNVGQLADAMARLLDNPDERFRLARGARQVFVDRLSRHAIMSSLDRVYRQILHRQAA